MPLPIIADDLAAVRSVAIKVEGPQALIMAMHAIYPADALPERAA